MRQERSDTVTENGTVVRRGRDSLAGWLGSVVDPDLRYDNVRLRMRADISSGALAAGAAVASRAVLPDVSEDAVAGLKFSDVLPPGLAQDTVALRLAEPAAAAQVLQEPRVWLTAGPSQ